MLSGGDNDYLSWLAHSDDISDPNDGCMLGYKEHFLRLKKDSVCWNGRDYVVNKQPTPCPCTLDDFLWSVSILDLQICPKIHLLVPVIPEIFYKHFISFYKSFSVWMHKACSLNILYGVMKSCAH